MGIQHLVLAAASVGSVVGLRCGEKTCGPLEYCSENTFCNSCSDICEEDSNNYDQHTCKTQCSEYLTSLYVRKEDLEAAVSKVYVYVVVSLVISVLVLLLVLGALLAVWLKYQRTRVYKSSAMKKKKIESIKAMCVNEVDGSKKLKLEMPPPRPEADTPHEPPSALTTMTPLSTRHPSEDATLEYAYDNPTLSHSPVFGKNQPHSTPNTTPKTTRTETSF